MTEDEAKRKMEAKVAKLMRLAEHPGTPPEEAASASAQASALMEKYALDEMMVARAAGHSVADKLHKKEYRYKGVYHFADVMLVNDLAVACHLKAIRSKLSNSEVKMVVLGFESDFTRFDMLLTSAMLQRVTATDRYIRGVRQWQWLTASQKYNEKRSFMVGFARGFGEKVAAASRQVEQEVKAEKGSGAELVLVERKDQVDKFVNNEFPRLVPGRGVKITGSHGAGVRAGQNANIGGTGLGGSRRAIGG